MTTRKKNQYVLGIIDNLTKYVHIEVVKNTTAAITVKKVREFILRFGAPNRIISDRGTCFTAHSFRSLCTEFGIKHTLNSSRHSQANGLIERLNRTLFEALYGFLLRF